MYDHGCSGSKATRRPFGAHAEGQRPKGAVRAVSHCFAHGPHRARNAPWPCAGTSPSGDGLWPLGAVAPYCAVHAELGPEPIGHGHDGVGGLAGWHHGGQAPARRPFGAHAEAQRPMGAVRAVSQKSDADALSDQVEMRHE